jgi:hypothetical protein
MNGNQRADVFEFQMDTSNQGGFALRSTVQTPTFMLDPTVQGTRCRDLFTGQRILYRMNNRAAGNLITPPSTVWGRMRTLNPGES